MTKVFELNNSHAIIPGTNCVRLPYSLDFAGRLKPVFLPPSRHLESWRSMAHLHHRVRNTFSPFLTIIMAKKCLHLLLGNVCVKQSRACIHVTKQCQPKCPNRSLSRCYQTRVSGICNLSANTPGTPCCQVQKKNFDRRLTGGYSLTPSLVLFC